MGLIHCNLRVLMAERGLNIQKVRDKTNLSRTTISNLVNNYGHGVQFDTLKQLCNLLDCQPGDLFTYIDISVNFEVATENPNINLKWKTPVEGSKQYKLSEIQVKLNIRCSLKYEGVVHELYFDIELNYGFDEYDNIDVFNVGIDTSFDSLLNQLKLLPFVKEFMRLELEDFLIDGATVMNFTDGIEVVFMDIVSYYEI